MNPRRLVLDAAFDSKSWLLQMGTMMWMFPFADCKVNDFQPRYQVFGK
jgi:hypothetical protein